MLRRLLWILWSLLFGIGSAWTFSSVPSVPTWVLVAIPAVLISLGVLTAWRGRGPIGLGQRAPHLAWAGGMQAAAALVVLPLTWRSLPTAMAVGGAIMAAAMTLWIPIGMLGEDAPSQRGARAAAGQPGQLPPSP
ncbi:hypothetical protein ACFFWC_12675 [Plantactinospora siamensis]|uniref:Uncharacterized protein n=1 Tax=Plantactinospora siamensis TaxID=555372 RepID=A0ABV6P1V3_9ACTN